jgi:hypothetical protein
MASFMKKTYDALMNGDYKIRNSEHEWRETFVAELSDSLKQSGSYMYQIL